MVADILIYLVAPALVGALGGYGIKRLSPAPRRRFFLTSWLFAPLLIYTLLLATAQPAEGGFWLWWTIGLTFLTVSLLVWAGAVLTGYLIAGARRAT